MILFAIGVCAGIAGRHYAPAAWAWLSAKAAEVKAKL